MINLAFGVNDIHLELIEFKLRIRMKGKKSILFICLSFVHSSIHSQNVVHKICFEPKRISRILLIYMAAIS